MELPVSSTGNLYVIVFQEFLTKWLLIFAAPDDQKAIRIAKLLAEELLAVQKHFCQIKVQTFWLKLFKMCVNF